MFWIEENISAHVDSASIWVSINSAQLDNIYGIEFVIEYDHYAIELDSDYCFCTPEPYECIVDSCPMTGLDAFYGLNTAELGLIDVVIFSIGSSIDGEVLKFKFNIKGSVGDYSNISFTQLRINDIDFINNVSNGSVVVGNLGCMDPQACNYSYEATVENGTCAYDFDCNNECGGDAVEDCFGVCQGSAIVDCVGECGGNAIIDECGICNGDGIVEGLCDCEGTAPFIYCIDGDGDGLGNPNYTYEFCDLIESDEFTDLVLNCEDIDDECIGDQFDSCGICGGNGPELETNCCPNTGVSISGESPDDCGVCGGDMFVGEYGIYPNGLCDCDGTPPIDYCIDIDGDGENDSAETFTSCYEQPLGFEFFIDCETLNINDIKLDKYQLFSIYPNPFNPSVTIDYKVDKLSSITIKILDLKGRYLKTLVNEVKMPGKYSVVWAPDKILSSGVYLLEMQYDNQVLIEKINFIK